VSVLRILAVDTTTSSGSVALLEDRRLVGEIAGESRTTHSARLLGAVDHLLRSEGLAIADIGAFAVAAGPGSFTGIRIGLSTVKALAFASGKPVVPVSSLRALALKLALAGASLVCPVLDAKKGEVYAALFETAEGRLVEVIRQGAYAPDDLCARLPAGRVIAFIGGGSGVYREKIVTRMRENAVFPSRTQFVAHEVGLLGLEGLGEGKGVPADGVEPLYFRRSQAEEKH
jgi:tRNA threonylcarbamoyladenosine biosynthesis protein TsaB